MSDRVVDPIFSPYPEERAAAATALGASDDPRAAARLVAMLRENDEQVHDAARNALALLTRDLLAPAAREPARASEWVPPPVYVLRGFVRAVRERSTEVKLLQSTLVTHRACAGALVELVRLCAADPTLSESTGATLLGMLSSAVPALRDAAVELIGEVGDPAMLAPLLAIAEAKGPPEPRRAAIRAVGSMAWTAGPALNALGSLAEREEGDLAWACREAIRQIRKAMEDAPDELISASAPQGTGTEPEAAEKPASEGDR